MSDSDKVMSESDKVMSGSGCGFLAECFSIGSTISHATGH